MAGKDTGIVSIHGKEYQTVAYRVGKFREAHKEYGLTTEIVFRDEDCVVMKATITNDGGRILATGHSEEFRQSSQINRTSALENSETSAIGRALAALGLGGTEFASADEVAHAITSKPGVIKPTDGAFNRCTPDRRKVVADSATMVKDYLAEDKDFDAYAICEGFTDPDEKVALWSFLDSKQRSRLKAQAEVANRKVA
jgi:hypothetical protein